MRRGGNRGGGTTPRRITLTTEAARALRRLAQPADPLARFTAEAASAAASDLIAQAAGRRLVYLTDDMLAALPYIEIELARGQCFSDEARRGLDQLVAALWAASAATQAEAPQTGLMYTRKDCRSCVL